MKPGLTAGLTATRRWTIDEARTISHMGEDGRVYATPFLLRDLEATCREFLLDFADPGEDSVGTRVELDHLAPTPLGMWVDFTITVATVDGRAVAFDFVARDGLDLVAKGRHGRFVADVEKTKTRLKAKADRARQG